MPTEVVNLLAPEILLVIAAVVVYLGGVFSLTRWVWSWIALAVPAGPSSASMTRTSCSLPSRSIRVATTPSRPARAAHAREATSTPLRAMACLSGMM